MCDNFFFSQKFRTHDITIIDGDKETAALYTEIDGKKIYLVNISAIKGVATDDRKTIVGATLDMVGTRVNIWKTESVTGRIVVQFPIAKPTVPLVPIIMWSTLGTQAE